MSLQCKLSTNKQKKKNVFNCKFICLWNIVDYQGIDGGPGEKGEDGESGQSVSIKYI